ncbi:hypothetical protein G9A89_017247 [Geosiphon pyriformis]|nr:hypothetical protein G9A89_017247 [Geosiphon pyriformis]
MVDLSASPLCLEELGGPGIEPVASWVSDVDSIASSIGNLSDLENLKNTVVEETSYVDSGASNNKDMDETTPRKSQTQTYVLGQPPIQPFFDNINRFDDTLELFFYKFSGFSWLSPITLCVHKKQSFNSVKFFALDVNLSAVTEKNNSDRLLSTFTSELSLAKAKNMVTSKKILVNNDLKKVNICSNQEVIVKKIPVNLPKLAVESKVLTVKVGIQEDGFGYIGQFGSG